MAGNAKQTYDNAAEVWHTHALACATCTLHGSERCEDGERLLRSENEAWSDYRQAAQQQRQQDMEARP